MTASDNPAAESPAERYERWFGAFMTPMAEALIEAVAPLAAGQRVLDVACGTGFVTRLAAEWVGADHVIGVDVSPGMIAAARRYCPRGVALARAYADRLPCADGSVDVVLCQQGLQHFPDQAAAFAEVARVLRPGGRVAATVWTGEDDNPLKAAQIAGIRAALGDEVAHQVADTIADGSERWLADGAARAGLGGVTVRCMARTVAIPSIADFLWNQALATRWGDRLAASRPDAQRIFVQAGMTVLSRYVRSDGSADIPFTTNLLLARRDGTR